MKLVYVAGKFSGRTRAHVEANIAAAVAAGLDVAAAGAMPVIPHANTAHPLFETTQPYTFWIEGTLEQLRRCDAVLMLPGWEEAKGATAEYTEALRLGMPVFFSVASSFREWVAAA